MQHQTCDEHSVPNLPDDLLPALRIMARAAEYANQSTGSRWHWSQPVDELLAMGLHSPDLRWLIQCQYIDQVRPTNTPAAFGEKYSVVHGLEVFADSRFILNGPGLDAVRHALATTSNNSPSDNGRHLSVTPSSVEEYSARDSVVGMIDESCPKWDVDKRQLWIEDELIKHYKVPAPNQELVLTAFENNGWRRSIADPLPDRGEDAGKRLQATIKSLNRNQKAARLRFHGNGTGESVWWEIIPA